MYLFVYGTLKHGFRNDRLLCNSKFIGEFSVPGFKMLSLRGFPGLIKSEQNNRILGEIYNIDDVTLSRCDCLEGYKPNEHKSSMYIRENLRVISEVGAWDCWVYLWNGSTDYPIIEDGIWR